jgi:lipopolysaccharide transport system ATP-binding protein
MSNVAIKVENLGKLYRLGEIGTGTLSHDLNRTWARLRGKEDPYSKIGEANDRTQKGSSDFVWSLKDVNFEVKQGEVLGIIGRNGAGKSTLLKMLSKVTAPTTGRIKIKGRIASLLEVGTGFHPELTGRENIFLNGAILGMTKAEIRSKFDEIVDFSGVERYIDTPVKRYSSGMYVRLAFAVAAFLEPEILIVDEVLAVGDAEFQKKCLGRMKDVSVNHGRTVLFVSHNMVAVKQLCTQGIILKNGTLDFSGKALQAIDLYNNASLVGGRTLMSLAKNVSPFIKVSSVTLNGSTTSPFNYDGTRLSVLIKGNCLQPVKLNLEVRFYSNENVLISFYSPGHLKNELLELSEGEFMLQETLVFPHNMANGEYYLSISLAHHNVETYFEISNALLIKEGFQNDVGRALNYNEVGFFVMESLKYNQH